MLAICEMASTLTAGPTSELVYVAAVTVRGQMSKSDLREWAVKGAEQRLVELAEEARTIFVAFPELPGRGRGFEVSRPGGSNRHSYARQARSQDDVSHRST